MSVHWEVFTAILTVATFAALILGVSTLVRKLRRSAGKSRNTLATDTARDRASNVVSAPTPFGPRNMSDVPQAPAIDAPTIAERVELGFRPTVPLSIWETPAAGTRSDIFSTQAETPTPAAARASWIDLLDDEDCDPEARVERHTTARRMARGSHPALPGLPPSSTDAGIAAGRGRSAVSSIAKAVTLPMPAQTEPMPAKTEPMPAKSGGDSESR